MYLIISDIDKRNYSKYLKLIENMGIYIENSFYIGGKYYFSQRITVSQARKIQMEFKTRIFSSALNPLSHKIYNYKKLIGTKLLNS